MTKAMQTVICDMLGWQRGNVGYDGGEARYVLNSREHLAAKKLEKLGVVTCEESAELLRVIVRPARIERVRM